MSLNLGRVMKVIEDGNGKWIKVPARSGTFHLKLTQMLLGEQYGNSKKRKEFDGDDQKLMEFTQAIISKHVLDWKGLQAADKSEIAFDPALFKNKTFIDAFLALTVEDGSYLSEWIMRTINKSDSFTEAEDPDFLASI